MTFVALPAQAGGHFDMKAHKEEMQKLLTGEVGLDAAMAEKVGAILSDSWTKKKEAKKAKHEAFKALEALVEAKETKVEVYEAALKRVKEAMGAFHAVKKASCDELGKLLDAKQLAILKVHMHKAHGGHDGHKGHKGHHGCKGDHGKGHHGKEHKGCSCKGENKDCGCKGENKDCGCKGENKDCGCKGKK
jgi:hypothetical protein